MARFVMIRFMQMVITLLLLSMALFGVIRLTGDPALLFLGVASTEEDYQAIRSQLGLDKPIYVQYGVFLANAMTGNFGESLYTKRPVIDSIKEMWPNTMQLVGLSYALGFMVGIPLAVMAATRKGRPIDTFARVIAGLGQCVPSFWLGLMMIQLFVIQLELLPSSGMGGWSHYIMPVACLTFFKLPATIRLIRSSMLEILDSEFIKLARSKGLPERVIIWKHALRNSILPVLSYAAMYLATAITAAVVVETVFAWPGIGRLAYIAIIGQDFPVIQGVIILVAAVVISLNFVADILYAYVDPRIRLRA